LVGAVFSEGKTFNYDRRSTTHFMIVSSFRSGNQGPSDIHPLPKNRTPVPARDTPQEPAADKQNNDIASNRQRTPRTSFDVAAVENGTGSRKLRSRVGVYPSAAA
jgi:hypothetical protein